MSCLCTILLPLSGSQVPASRLLIAEGVCLWLPHLLCRRARLLSVRKIKRAPRVRIRLLSIPEMSSLEMRGAALSQEVVKAPLLPPLEGLVEHSLSLFIPPPAKMKKGFYCRYLIVPEKGVGFRPILDL